MAATFNGNLRAAIICYSPTNVSEETDLVAFYDELSSLVDRKRIVAIRRISFSLNLTYLSACYRFIWCKYEMSVSWWILLSDD